MENASFGTEFATIANVLDGRLYFIQAAWNQLWESTIPNSFQIFHFIQNNVIDEYNAFVGCFKY